MPRCESCGSIVRKDEISLDQTRQRTWCSRCDSVGQIFNEPYQFNMRITNVGIEVHAQAPQAQFEYADTWGGVRAKFKKMQDAESGKKPHLSVVGEK